MPLTNAINKNSDTFFATSNITANFTSPVLTTVVSATTYTNRISGVLQSTNESILTSEYYSNTTTTATGSFLYFTRALGTKSAPVNLTSTQVPAMNMRFAGYISGAFADRGYIRTYVNSSSFSNIVINSTSSYFRVADWVYTPALFYAANDSNITETSASGSFALIGGIDGNTGAQYRGNFIQCGGTTQRERNIGAYTFSNITAQAAGIVLARSRGTTVSGVNDIQANDPVGEIRFASYQLGYRTCALIAVDNDNSLSGSPGRIIFSTVPVGTNTITESMRIDNAGRITQIRQPSFSASLSADVANATGDGTAYTVAFDTEQYDQGSNFAANTFTAPIAGRYRFAYTISVDDLLVGHTKLELTVGGRVVERCNPYAIADSDGFCLLSGMVDLSLAASATVTMVVTVSGSTKTVTVKGTTSSGTFLSGQLQV